MSTRGRRLLRRAAIALALLALVEPGYRLLRRVQSWRESADPAAFPIYAVGGSTLAGVPFNDRPGAGFSAPQLVARMLGGAASGRPIAVHNLAMQGHSIYPQWVALARAVEHRDPRVPGVVLIYTGENEGFAPGSEDPPPTGLRAFLELSVAPRSPLVRDALYELAKRGLLHRRRAFDSFELYLRRTVETARAHGLVPVLAPFVSNIAGVEPNCVDRPDREALHRVLREQAALVERGAHAEAARLLTEAAARDPDAAPLLHYLAGRAFRAMGDPARARESFWTAVDLDPRNHFGRATRRQNDLMRRLAAESRVPLADTIAAFERSSPDGLIGDELFADGHHPNLRGHLLLAETFARTIADHFHLPPPSSLSETDAIAEFHLDEDRLIAAHTSAAAWLIATSVHHPLPTDRCALAASHLQWILARRPDDTSALLGLAIVQAASRGGLLRDEQAVSAMGRWAIFYRPHLCVPPGEIGAFIKRLREAGADDAIVGALNRQREAGQIADCR